MTILPTSPKAKRRNLREILRKGTKDVTPGQSPKPVKSVLGEYLSWSSMTLNTQSSISSHDDRSARREKPPVVFVDEVVCVGEAICEDEIIAHSSLDSDTDLIEPLTDEERKCYFYTNAELKIFEKERSLTVRMYVKRREAGVAWEEKEYCVRGLESMIRKSLHTHEKMSSREAHSEKILGEQAKAKKLGGMSAEKLREISRASSKVDRTVAFARAREDAARCGHKPPRTEGIKKVFLRSSSRVTN